MTAKKPAKTLTGSVKRHPRKKCPNDLIEVIALVNRIPPERKLCRFEKLLGDTYEPWLKREMQLAAQVSIDVTRLSAIDPDPVSKARRLLKGKLKDLPPEFRNPWYYEKFREMRMLLHELAQAAQHPEDYRKYIARKWRGFPLNSYVLEQRRAFAQGEWDEVIGRFLKPKWIEDLDAEEARRHWPEFRVSFKLNEENQKWEINSRGIFQFDVTQIDPSYLRECEICFRIIWAKYENSRTCRTKGPKCANTLHQRERRDREKREDYKAGLGKILKPPKGRK